jgi:hypothetical protein
MTYKNLLKGLKELDLETSLGILGVAGVAALTVMLGVLLFASVARADDSYGGGVQPFQANAQLSGAAEVPPVATAGYGSFSLESSNNSSASYSLSAFGLGSAFTAAHIHCGAAGVNGPVVVPLNLGNGSFGSGDIQQPAGGNCATPIYDIEDLKMAIQNGHIYVNVHTTNYPNGEIRGQVSGNYSSGNSGYGMDDRKETPCARNYHGWSWKDNCWCDNGKPNYDKDHYGRDKKHGDNFDHAYWWYDDKNFGHDKKDEYRDDHKDKKDEEHKDEHYGDSKPKYNEPKNDPHGDDGYADGGKDGKDGKDSNGHDYGGDYGHDGKKGGDSLASVLVKQVVDVRVSARSSISLGL